MAEEIEKLEKKLAGVMSYYDLKSFYKSCAAIAQARPELFEVIAPLMSQGLKHPKNDYSSLYSFYDSCYTITQSRPELTGELLPLLSQALQNPENEHYSLEGFYKSFAAITHSRPELAKDTIPLLSQALPHRWNDSASLRLFYQSCRAIAQIQPELTEEILPLLPQAVQNYRNDFSTLSNFYKSCAAIAEARPELAGDILPLLSQALQNSENDDNSLENFYNSCASIAQAQPELFKDIIPLMSQGLQNPNNNYDSLISFYNSCAAVAQARPELVKDIIPLLSQALQNPRNNYDSLSNFYGSCAAIVQARPESGGDILPLVEQGAKLPQNELADVADENEWVEEPYEDSNCPRELRKAYMTIGAANPDCVNQVFANLLQLEHIEPGHFNEFEQRMIKFNFFSSKLSMKEKQYFFDKGLDFAAKINGGLYLKIKNTLLDLEMHDQKHAGQQIESKEQLFDSVSEWLMPCAIGLQQFYGKEYLSYLQKIVQYNANVDKQIKAQTPEMIEKREQKLAGIWQAVEKQQAREENFQSAFEHLDEQRLRAVANEAKNVHQLELDAAAARNDWIAENIKTRRLKTDYAEASRNIVYTADYRLDVHNALDWMVNTDSVKDKEGFKKFVDSNLFYSNKFGQKLCRLYAPAFDNERMEIVNTNEIKVITGRWNSLSESEKTLGYNEVYSICQSMCYEHQQDATFAKEANRHGVSETNYKKYEDIYLKSQQTESVFDSAKILSRDNLRVRIAPRQDVRVGFAGKYTSCCQHFGGIGHDCAVDSMIGPKSGALLIEEYNSKTDDWNMLGVSWIYESKRKFGDEAYKVLTLDNVEMKRKSPEAEKLLLSFVKDLQQEKGYYQVNVGTSRNDIDIDGFADDKEGKNPLPDGYSGYSDAGSQLIMVQATPEDLANGIVKPLDETLPDIYITGATENDLKGAQEVARRCFPEGDQNLAFPEENPRGMLLKDGNKTVGYVIWSDTEKYISDMAVLPEYRKDKNASSAKLLAAMLKHVNDTGGEWSAELRDSTSLRYMQAMEKRGLVEMTIEGTDRRMSDSSQVKSVRFKPIKESERREKLAVVQTRTSAAR